MIKQTTPKIQKRHARKKLKRIGNATSAAGKTLEA
jgi:hypothetical protein